MIKFLKKLFRFKKKKIKTPMYSVHYYERMFPPFNYKPKRKKQIRPAFPSTFVFEDYVYEQWNQDLIDNHGWTKKEIKQGWRYIK